MSLFHRCLFIFLLFHFCRLVSCIYVYIYFFSCLPVTFACSQMRDVRNQHARRQLTRQTERLNGCIVATLLVRTNQNLPRKIHKYIVYIYMKLSPPTPTIGWLYVLVAIGGVSPLLSRLLLYIPGRLNHTLSNRVIVSSEFLFLFLLFVALRFLNCSIFFFYFSLLTTPLTFNVCSLTQYFTLWLRITEVSLRPSKKLNPPHDVYGCNVFKRVCTCTIDVFCGFYIC